MHKINVSVVYAKSEKQWLFELEVSRGTQAFELFELSNFRSEIPELQSVDLEQIDFGIYSSKVSSDYLMQDGDRLEIYRPLHADPKEVRRQLAEVGKTMGKK